MEKIKDLSMYTARMEAGMEDKLFFLNHLQNPPLIIDYGCANGMLLKHIKEIYPDAICYGYDASLDMLTMARETLKEYKDVHLSLSKHFKVLKLVKNDEKELFQYEMELQGHDEILNLSSVIHEVYAYSSEKEIKEFWENMMETEFERISIRDMCFQKSTRYPSQFKDFKEFYNCFLEGIKKNGLEGMWEEYRKVYPSIVNYQSIVHFLLKYKYVENWDREVKENYFPLSYRDIKKHIPDSYEIEYERSYLLPYVHDMVLDEFGINLDCCTHIQMILKKRVTE